MKKYLVGVGGLALVLVALSGHASFQPNPALAQVTSCQFAGYDSHGSVYNTNITCATPSTGPQATPTGGTCIAVTTPPPAGSVAYTCASPTPFPTPSPVSTSTAGAPLAIWTTNPGGLPQLSVDFPVGGGGTPAPNTMLKSSNSTWDAVALAETSATHVYPMNDASGCTQVADAIAGGATAVPSPVPLPTPTTASTIVCGAPTISNDGETSVAFPGTAASSYLIAPHSIWPASGSFSVEIVAKGEVLMGGGGGNYTGNSLWCADGATALISSVGPGGVTIASGPPSYSLDINNTIVKQYAAFSASDAIDQVVTWDGTNIRQYINGHLVETVADTPGFSASNGAVGTILTGGPQQPWVGRLAKFAIYNTALSQTKILTHVAALGL